MRVPFSYGQFEGEDDAPEQLREKEEEISALRALVERLHGVNRAPVVLLATEVGEPFRGVQRRSVAPSDLDSGFFFVPPEVVTVGGAE